VLKIQSKKVLASFFTIIMLLTAMLCIPRVSAQAQELVVLGQDTDIHANYYNGHLVCNGFGAVIAMALPTGRFQITATKGLFAASLGGGWSEGSGCSEAFYTPFVGSMWFEVAGGSPYFPSPNVIVDNTGSGGNCSESFIILIEVLATALPLLYELLKETPSLTEWQRPSAHSLMAISRDLTGGSLTLAHGLRTAAADFYSRFDVRGVQTLTVTAWAEIWLQKYMPYYRDGVVVKWKVGEYSVGFSVDVVVDLPPYNPPHPEGTTTGYKGVSYTYDAGTTDPEGDNIMYEFDWGDGTTTLTGWVDSGTMVSRSHSWSSTGTYYVKVRAQDSYGLWSAWSVKLQVNIVNRAPNTPSTPSGPTSGETGTSYTYSTSTTDPDGDNISYEFHWGDGSYTLTYAHPSGATASVSYTWYSPGTYYVKVRAKDAYGAWSGYSSSLTVTITGDPISGGGCPFLYVYDGKEYFCEGLLDIHNPEGIDVIYGRTLVTTPQRVKGAYLLRLTEHPQTHSYIVEVKLYAILEDKTMIELPLIWVWHSEDGNVLPQLLHSDDWKTDTLGADLNNGVSQSIDLKFAALSPNMKITGFVFQIEGNNMIVKV